MGETPTTPTTPTPGSPAPQDAPKTEAPDSPRTITPAYGMTPEKAHELYLSISEPPPETPEDDILFQPQEQIDALLDCQIGEEEQVDISEENIQRHNKKYEVDLVKRWMWGAMDPLYQQPLCTPVEKILFTDTRTVPCETTEQCYRLLHKQQKYYMEVNKLPDIPWNFMIGGDGKVYEGRGWTTNAGKITPPLAKYDCQTLDIAFIGHWNDEEPPIVMTQAANNLINLGQHKCAIDMGATIESELLDDYVEPERQIKHWTEWKLGEEYK